MTSVVNSHDARGQFVTFMVVARATGGDGACNGDGRSCWYPWIGYHLTGVRRGACFAL